MRTGATHVTVIWIASHSTHVSAASMTTSHIAATPVVLKLLVLLVLLILRLITESLLLLLLFVAGIGEVSVGTIIVFSEVVILLILIINIISRCDDFTSFRSISHWIVITVRSSCLKQ